MERAVRLQESLDHPMTGFSPKASLFEQLRWSDTLDPARALGEEVRDALRARDDPFEANLIALLALMEWRAGDWSRAAELGEAGRALHEQSGWIALGPMQSWPRTVIAAHRGQLDQAHALAGRRSPTRRSGGDRDLGGSFRWILGSSTLARGEREAALVHLRLARELREGLGLLEPNNRLELPDLLDALVAVGELEEAETVLDALGGARAQPRPGVGARDRRAGCARSCARRARRPRRRLRGRSRARSPSTSAPRIRSSRRGRCSRSERCSDGGSDAPRRARR